MWRQLTAISVISTSEKRECIKSKSHRNVIVQQIHVANDFITISFSIWKYSWKYSVSLRNNNIVLEIENNGAASISLSTEHRNSTVKMKRWKDGNRGFVRSASKRLIIASLAAPLRFHVRECLASTRESEEVISLRAIACRVRGTWKRAKRL